MKVPTRLPSWALDVFAAVVFTAFSLMVTIAIERDSTDPFDSGTVILILVIGASMVLWRRRPEVVLLVAVPALMAYSARRYVGGPIYLAPLPAIASIASTGDRRRTAIAAIGTVGAFATYALLSERSAEYLPHALGYGGWVVVAVFVGRAVHNRRLRIEQLQERARELEESREEEARRQVAEERLRIARDLHDVIAHGIATIHVQAAAGMRLLATSPEQAGEALATIKQVSKRTLDELRATVGVLRTPADEAAPLAPTPGIDRLPALVEDARDAGLEVALRCEGPLDEVPTAVDVAVYRIVQESLTNVVRHAGALARAEVSIVREPGALLVEVCDDGLGVPPGRNGGGHGIAGMRERAATLGGELEAGPRPGRGFRVRARLPFADAPV